MNNTTETRFFNVGKKASELCNAYKQKIKAAGKGHITDDSIAKRVGCSRSHLSYFFSGERLLGRHKLVAFCDAIDASPDERKGLFELAGYKDLINLLKAEPPAPSPMLMSPAASESLDEKAARHFAHHLLGPASFTGRDQETQEFLRQGRVAASDAATPALYERIQSGHYLPGIRWQQDDQAHILLPLSSSVLESPRYSLPALPTPLIGRETELTEIAHLLANPACRHITLVGPGGIGKTHLALHVAHEHVKAFNSGVCFVALAPVESAEFLASTIAHALNLRSHGSANPRAQLLTFLREKVMLLILDNIEHLLAGTDLLTAILEHAPGVKLLVTSRERVNLPGEWIVDIHGLLVPDGDEVAEVEQSSAGHLFLKTARRVRPNFPSTDMSSVAHICRIVEGMPLGIELAAGWARTLPVVEIARELERGLEILTTTSRYVPKRHRSIYAVFDWSWDQLSPEERSVLRRMAIFRGGFTREAAEYVAGTTLITLSTLVDKSLLRLTEQARYEMHELCRQYTYHHLQQAGEGDWVGERHLEYYMTLVAQAEPHLKSAKQQQWLVRLEQEHDNIRAALSWCHEYHAIRQGLELAGGLGLFWLMRAYILEGRKWLQSLLDQTEAKQPTAARANALYWLGRLVGQQGAYPTARFLYEESLAISTTLDQPHGIAAACYGLGYAALYSYSYHEATTYFEQSLALYRMHGDIWGSAWSLCGLAGSAWYRADYIRMESYFTESWDLFKRSGDRWSSAWPQYGLGAVALRRDDYSRAETLLNASISLYRELNDRHNIAWVLQTLGIVVYLRGNYTHGRACCAESLTLSKELEDWDGCIYALNALGDILMAQGEYPLAQQHYEEGLVLGQKHADREGMGWNLYGLGWVMFVQRDEVQANTLWRECLAIFDDINDKLGHAQGHYALGRLTFHQANFEQAHESYMESVRNFSVLGDRWWLARCFESLAGIAAHQGDGIFAARLFGAAESIREAIGAPLPPVDRVNYDHCVTITRVQMNDQEFSAAWAAGRHLTVEQTVTEVLNRFN